MGKGRGGGNPIVSQTQQTVTGRGQGSPCASGALHETPRAGRQAGWLPSARARSCSSFASLHEPGAAVRCWLGERENPSHTHTHTLLSRPHNQSLEREGARARTAQDRTGPPPPPPRAPRSLRAREPGGGGGKQSDFIISLCVCV